MARFIEKHEVERLRAAKPESFQAHLYVALRERTYASTRCPGIVQPQDQQEWWHICWERISDAAFVWHMERNVTLGEWIRGVAFWLRDIAAEEWLGPWFRSKSYPLIGSLETAHISVALCEILDLCDGLFTAAEEESLKAALREKGMVPCLRFCERVQREHTHINNWYNVLLMGYGISALFLQDEAAIQNTLRFLQDSYSLYNADSYGESLDYSNYASLTLAHLNEIFLRMRPELENRINLSCYAQLMDWYAASFLYMKPWDDATVFARMLNFADSAAVFRPSGDMLVQIAVRMKDILPRQAALAAWLFETTYTNPEILAGFDFIKQHRYHAVLMQPDMAAARSPARAGLCEALCFENGHAILRDSWEDTRAVLAVQAGYASMNVTSHRHQDHGSFQFVQGKERMIVDGGHCCYRLNAYRFSCSTSQHAVMDFIDDAPAGGFGQPMNPFRGVHQQKLADGNFYVRKPPRTVTLMNQYIGRAHVLAIDTTDAYGEEVLLARRAFVSVLPNAVFVIDVARTAQPLKMRTHFPLNNRDGALKVHRADEQRYVFRRNGEAMKLFECAAYVDGKALPSRMQFDWGYCHRNYHPLANTQGQAKEGSAEIYNWVDAQAGKTHMRVCAIAADRDERIKGWHIKAEANGDWYIESPEREKVLKLRVWSEHVYLEQDGQWIEVL